jgi:hypothetical protein
MSQCAHALADFLDLGIVKMLEYLGSDVIAKVEQQDCSLF